MKILTEEIENYLRNVSIAPATKNRNKKYLYDFAMHLSLLTETPISELHLMKIYVVTDRSGTIVAFQAIKPELIDSYLFSKVGIGFHYLCHVKSAISSFFNYLYRKYDFENIAEQIKFRVLDYQPADTAKRVLRRHDVLRFVHCLVTESVNLKRDLLLFTILLHTGCRISELLNIKVADVNFLDDTIFLKKTKNKVQRLLILRDGFGQILKTYCHQEKLKDTDFVFRDSTQNKMCTETVRELMNLYLCKANLPHITIHALRHTFATLMYESDASLLFIQQLLGHARLHSTERYIHPNYVRNSAITISNNEKIYEHLRRSRSILQF